MAFAGKGRHVRVRGHDAIIYEPAFGESIQAVARITRLLAARNFDLTLGEIVELRVFYKAFDLGPYTTKPLIAFGFNGVPVVVAPGDWEDDIVRKYHEGLAAGRGQTVEEAIVPSI